MNYLITFLFLILLIIGLTACENTRHSIGVSGKPLSQDYEKSIKMNYKIIFGKVRPKEDDED